MIIPTKYLRENETLLGAGATLLQGIGYRKSISSLWEETKCISSIDSYERFILTLDLLFLFGLIVVEDNEIIRVKQ